jgi:hypothetical protein
MPKVFATCPECSAKFERKHHRAQFCSPAHSKDYSNRQLAEGQRIVALAKAWRAGRNTSNPELKQASKDAFAMMCRELDALNKADTEARRVPALKVFFRRFKAGLLDYQGALNR